MQSWVSLSAGLFGGVALGALGWIAFVPPPGVVLWVDGYEYVIGDPDAPDAKARVREAVQVRAKQLLSEEITIRTDELSFSGTASDFGYVLDENAAVAAAWEGVRIAHAQTANSLGVRLSRRFSSTREIEHEDLSFVLEPSVAAGRLAKWANVVDRPAVDAEMLISEHKIILSQEGRRMSVDATVVRLQAAGVEGASLVEAVVERVRPRVTEDDLAPVDVTRVLAHYETSFRGKAGPRAVNIRTAGRYLDGAIILPGEVLSFNEEVGRRIPGRGFVDAPVIINDELEQDVGGGVCQVATTLHAAAVFGNLDVVTRRSHSRPSGYAPLGLDATVIDGKVDLKLRNPFDEPVLVHVSFPSAYAIRVELLGRDPDVEVTHGYTVTARESFSRRVWYKEEAPAGVVEQKQKGSEGMDVVSELRIKSRDGSVARRTYASKYYPVPEVFWLGEGAKVHTLPPLPEAAVGLVINGEEVASPAGGDLGKPQAGASPETNANSPAPDERATPPTDTN